MKNFLKKSVAALIVIVMIAATIPVSLITVFAAEEDQIAEGYVYCFDIYYDSSNPNNNVYGNSEYAYKAYYNVTEQSLAYNPMVFTLNGKIVRDEQTHRNLMIMFFSQHLKNLFRFQNDLSDARFIIDIAQDIRFVQVGDEILSWAAELAGSLTATCVSGGGNLTADAIVDIVVDKAIDELKPELSDVAKILTNAQMIVFKIYCAKLQQTLYEMESIEDFNSFSNCKKYYDYSEELEKLSRGAMILLPYITEEMDKSFLERLGSLTKDFASGFIGGVGEYIDDAVKIAELKKNTPEAIAELIIFAGEISKFTEDTDIGAVNDILSSASDFLKDQTAIVEAYVGYDEVVTEADLLQATYKFFPYHYPDNTSTSTTTEATESEATEPSTPAEPSSPSTSLTSAPTIGKSTVEERIKELQDILEGEYFTSDNKICRCDGGDYSDRCYNVSVIKSSWFKSAFSHKRPSSYKQLPIHYTSTGNITQNAWSCAGFANFAMWYIFASKSTDDIYVSKIKTISSNKENFEKYAKTGDVLRSSGGHSAIFISANSDGIKVLDSNWGNYNKVDTHTISYSKYASWTISRAKNYDVEEENTLSVTYNANGGTIPSSETVATEYKVTVADGLNVRASASASATKLGAIKKGTSINVTETKNSGGYTWGKITYQNQDGWVALGVISGESYTEKVSTTESSDYYVNSSIVYKTSTSKPHTSKFVYGKEYKDGYANGVKRFGLEREGYIFMGWSLSPNGTNYLPDDVGFRPEEIVPEVANGSKSITVYAVWEPVLPETTDDTVKNIYITSIPQKNYYTVGDSIPKEDIEIVVEHTDGRLVRKTEGFTCIPSTLSFEGTQEVEVYYEGASAKFTVQVTDAKSRANNATANSNATGYLLPSTSSATLKDQGVWKDDKLQVLCRDGDFYLCLIPWGSTTTNKTNGTLLYIKASAITVSGSVPDADEYYSMSNGINNAVITADTKLYYKPDGGTNSITYDGKVISPKSISKDTEIKVLFELDGYYCVQTSKYTGFVSKSVVKFNTISCGVSADITKDEFYVDDNINESSITVTVTMSDGSIQSATNADITIPDTGVAGEKYITVQAGEFFTFIPVTVKEMEISGITITKLPNKTLYVSGEEFDKSGMSVSVTYGNGSVVDITDDVAVEYNFEEAGYTRVAVSYGGKVKYISVLVYDRPDFEVYDVTGSKGDTVGVPISYYSYTDAITPNSVKFILLYDAQSLEYMDNFVTSLEDISGLSVVEVEAGHLEISYEGNESLPASCILVNLEFKLISEIDSVSQIHPCNIELCDSLGNSFELNTYIGNVYNVKTYALTLYNPDGSIFGKGEVGYGEGLMLFDKGPEREGYIFVGWSEEQNAESATYFVNDVVILERDINLYPVWEKLDDASSEEETDEPTEEKPTEEETDAPMEEKPTEEETDAPMEEKPTEEETDAPTEEKPTEEETDAPTESTPTEEETDEPTVEAPTDEAPTDEAPTDEAPTEETSTEETPTEENKTQLPTITIGCNASLYNSFAIVAACALAIAVAVVLKKKKIMEK